jgi:cyclic beta-1,2-glucan synthetase
MSSVTKHLIHTDDGLVLLFTPPFDTTEREPGYIKGYPPGIRENGGQYTHAAVWSAIAFALLGEGDKAAEIFSMVNPINRTGTPEALQRYGVEPYVVSADVYSEAPHRGRGGWTWYTGSAGWLYRAGIEWILGFRIQGTSIHLDPCIPKTWKGFEMEYQHKTAHYGIIVENPEGVCRGVVRWTLDDAVQSSHHVGSAVIIPLVDDGSPHHVRVVLGKV